MGWQTSHFGSVRAGQWVTLVAQQLLGVSGGASGTGPAGSPAQLFTSSWWICLEWLKIWFAAAQLKSSSKISSFKINFFSLFPCKRENTELSNRRFFSSVSYSLLELQLMRPWYIKGQKGKSIIITVWSHSTG